MRFQIGPAAIDGLLDEAVKLGASRIDGVSLVASDEAIAQAETTAIAQASQQAPHQADSALGSPQLRQQLLTYWRCILSPYFDRIASF